ncbi:MAG: hypothetical protein ACI9TY_000979 [Alphaproteobacteria bacterium]|jgi:hypothetical protein
MTHENTENPIVSEKQSLLTRLKMSIASTVVNFLYGRDMTITSFKNSAVAGSVIFWYFENGTRHFVMVKNSKNGQARFSSCLGLGEHSDITAATKSAVKTLLGDVFYKSLDAGLISVDRVSSVPTFKCEDVSSGTMVPVNGVVWTVQITAEQAQLCQPMLKNIDIVAIPEYALLGKEVTPSHQMIYQSALKHIHGTASLLQQLGIDQVDDMFKEMRPAGSKIIH